MADKQVNSLERADRDIAMVFQNYALYPHMKVFDNMAYGLKIKKFPKDEIKERVKNAAQILELSHLLDRRPRELSGGQRQRSEEHTSELQSRGHLVCRLLLEKKKNKKNT